LERGVDLSASTAGDLASKQPKMIGPDELAARAVQMMELSSITSLVVCEERRIVGVIHLHDLLRNGIV
jgi:arabinose-5-phosphate isomerase